MRDKPNPGACVPAPYFFEKLLNIMDTLLGENGCPWDKEQTHESIRPNMIEECNEAVEAIDNGSMGQLKEELGDVLLQVLFHAKIAEKNGHFTIEDVVNALSDKLIRRHSHICGGDTAKTAGDALKIWKLNKQKEKF